MQWFGKVEDSAAESPVTTSAHSLIQSAAVELFENEMNPQR
jgi:hypothetical protein